MARSTGCACQRSTRQSVFGNLLDRGAGSFRFGPYGIHVPTRGNTSPAPTCCRRRGTHPVVGWGSRTRWSWGRGKGPDTVTPHTRPPVDDDAAPPAGAVRHLSRRRGRDRIGVRADLRLRSVAAQWTLDGDDGHLADATDAGVTLRLATDLSIGIEGGAIRARHVLPEGDTRVLRPVMVRRGGPADRRRRGKRPRPRNRLVLARLAGPSPHSRPRPTGRRWSARRWRSRA